jgi:hypothetical protein
VSATEYFPLPLPARKRFGWPEYSPDNWISSTPNTRSVSFPERSIGTTYQLAWDVGKTVMTYSYFVPVRDERSRNLRGMERRCRARKTTIAGLGFALMDLRSGRGGSCQGRIDIKAGLMFLSLGLEVMIYRQLRLEFGLAHVSVFMDSQEGDGISTTWIEAKEPVFLLLIRRRITAMLLVRKASRILKDLFD